jgi:hypothetical protein
MYWDSVKSFGVIKRKVAKKSGVMGGKMLCTTVLRDVCTTRKLLGSRLQAVL